MCGLLFIFDIYFIWKAFNQYKLNVKRFGLKIMRSHFYQLAIEFSKKGYIVFAEKFEMLVTISGCW